MEYSDATLALITKGSNIIEGVPSGSRTWDNHLIAAKVVRAASEDGQLLSPRALHTILFSGFGGDEGLHGHNAGEYRRIAVGIKNFQNTVVFPRHNEVPDMIEEWFVEADNEVDYEEAKRWHYHCWFEAIHPFPDGNGRVGRLLLWNMAMIQDGELEYIHEENYGEYVKRLEEWSRRNEFVTLMAPRREARPFHTIGEIN
jgi:Fic family protein